MALWQSRPPLLRLFRGRHQAEAQRRLRERQEQLARATEEWQALLREMEHNGESGKSQYERYYQAYLQARRQQKDIDLQLFNRRRGLCE